MFTHGRLPWRAHARSGLPRLPAPRDGLVAGLPGLPVLDARGVAATSAVSVSAAVPFCERGHPCPRPETPVMFPIVPPPGPKPASPVIGPCHCCLQRLCCLCSTPSSPCGPSLRGLHITRQDCTPGERDTGSKGVQRESTSAGGDLKTFTPGQGPCLYAHRPDSR